MLTRIDHLGLRAEEIRSSSEQLRVKFVAFIHLSLIGAPSDSITPWADSSSWADELPGISVSGVVACGRPGPAHAGNEGVRQRREWWGCTPLWISRAARTVGSACSSRRRCWSCTGRGLLYATAVPDDQVERVRQAAAACPVQAILLGEEVSAGAR